MLNGKEYPLANKDELTKELNYLKREFFYYKDFAGLEINEIFSEKILSESDILFVNDFNSKVLINRGSEFEQINLPLISQIAPVRDIQVLDFNNDNREDILLVGNNSNVSTYFGSFESSYGILLKGNGDGTFDYINQKKSGRIFSDLYNQKSHLHFLLIVFHNSTQKNQNMLKHLSCYQLEEYLLYYHY